MTLACTEHLGVGRDYKTSDIITCATEIAGFGGMSSGIVYARPEFRTLLLEWAATPNGREIEPKRLGYWLRRIHGKVYGINDILGSWCIEAAATSQSHGNRWRLVRV